MTLRGKRRRGMVRGVAVVVDEQHRLAALGTLVRIGATAPAAACTLDAGATALLARLIDQPNPDNLALALGIELDELAARCVRIIRASRATG